VSSIVIRAIQSARDGTFRQKIRVRIHEIHWGILHQLEWLVFYLGKARWQCAVKAWYMRLWGAEVGKNLYMERAVMLKGAEDLKIGDNVAIGAFSLINAAGGLIIEDNVNISTGCRVVCVNHQVPPVGIDARFAPCWSAPIRLKKGCWLATNAIILPGVTVGEGAVVVAGSLVTKDVPDWAYVAGVPAKFMMFREGYKPPKPKPAEETQTPG
jgi:acetyltransferase-like isoleucine patch superfamily enzyme